MVCLLLAGSLVGISACGNKELLTETQIVETVMETEDTQSGTESIAVVMPETETEVKPAVTEDGIFHWGAEEYFPLFQGNWEVVEYAGYVPEHGFDESYEEWYREEIQDWTEEVIAKSMGNEFRIELDNLEFFGPICELPIVIEDDASLFFITRYMPGEFVDLTPPYIGVSIKLKDKGDWYDFIADADGTVLVGIEYHFFRLEKDEK